MKIFLDSSIVKIRCILMSGINFANSQVALENRRGGCYLVILEAKSGDVLYAIKIGDPPAEKVQKYFDFALGQAKAVWEKRDDFCLTSSELNLFDVSAGAVLCGGLIFSLSWHIPEVGEALAAILAIEFSDPQGEKHLEHRQELRRRLAANPSFRLISEHLRIENSVSNQSDDFQLKK